MLSITELRHSDITEIAGAFAALGWHKPAEQYERYLQEQDAGAREIFVARWSGVFAGYVTVLWRPDYPPFAERGVPEIQDFNVLPQFRRRHIGTVLMDVAEARILERSPTIGIGVGLHEDYGAAQRLYVLRGYVPDGRGITSHGRRVNWGDEARIDDDLVLWLTKSVS
ncbi:MAG TPA: GNAT family N-acetyltransferase [Rhizomicrobium sp.]|nr:GNAT family N-acetyltransferase [Rhizomicrobium sp.]